MTNKEIISSLRGIIGKYNFTDKEWQTIEKTIKVLSNSYEDCISRTQAIKAMDELENEDIEAYGCKIPEGFDGERARLAICLLPSIQPTAKENLVVEDCISREEVCDYIAEFVNHEYATDREREMVKHIIGGIQHLSSVQSKPIEGDAISRKAVLNTLDSMDKALTEDRTVEEYKEVLEECYKVLPSIQQKPKTGHWIISPNDCFASCSKCGLHSDKGIYKHYRWCPNCGAKMKSEDKEWE